MKKIGLNPEQLSVESFHMESDGDGAPGTVHGHSQTLPNSQCPVLTCAATCATYVCEC
jgi:hypothetical protein